MPDIGRSIRRLVAAPFAASSRQSVLTLLPSSLAPAGGRPVSSYLGPCSRQDLNIQVNNALSVGIAHVACPTSGLASSLGTMSGYRVIPVRGGRYIVEVALVASIASDLHPPGPDCFESYELLPGGELLTPDLVIAGDHSNELIFAFSRQLLDADYEEPTSVEVACNGHQGDRNSIEYALSNPIEWPSVM